MALQPQERRRHRLLGDGGSRALEDPRPRETQAELLDLGAGASVVLLHGAADRVAIGVVQDDRGDHPAHADRHDLTAIRELPGERRHVGPPFADLLLGPSGPVCVENHRTLGLGNEPARWIQEDRLRRGRADVDAQQEGHARAASMKRRTRSASTGFHV